ncbi:hypothetical protein CD932_17785 [Janthinobacterium sp. PC23-8]|nr:hypothetical protein CD932_17785 [Janthinobacterium sp. PC23-8]
MPKNAIDLRILARQPHWARCARDGVAGIASIASIASKAAKASSASRTFPNTCLRIKQCPPIIRCAIGQASAHGNTRRFHNFKKTQYDIFFIIKYYISLIQIFFYFHLYYCV